MVVPVRVVMPDARMGLDIVLVPHRLTIHQTHLALSAHTSGRTQHGRRHRAPNREQRSEQHQEPDAKDFHYVKSSRPVQSMHRQSIHTTGCPSGKVKRGALAKHAKATKIHRP